jgi:PII-like signaling protein
MKNAPVMVSIIDREDAIKRFLPRLDEMISEGLVATSDVQIVKFTSKTPG